VISPSASVSPANSHSTECSTLIIRGWYSRPISGRYTKWTHRATPRNIDNKEEMKLANEPCGASPVLDCVWLQAVLTGVLASHSAKVSYLNVPAITSEPPSFVTSRALSLSRSLLSRMRSVLCSLQAARCADWLHMQCRRVLTAHDVSSSLLNSQDTIQCRSFCSSTLY
jgi:hypothetical protein